MVFNWIQIWHVMWQLEKQEVLGQVDGGVGGRTGESNICSVCSIRMPRDSVSGSDAVKRGCLSRSGTQGKKALKGLQEKLILSG